MFTAETVSLHDDAVVLLGPDNVVEAFFPPGTVQYVKRYAETIDTVPAVPTFPTPPTPSGDPPSYTLAQVSELFNVSIDTLRERCKDGRYPNAWKNYDTGKKGAPPWMIPVTDLGMTLEEPVVAVD